MSEGKQRVEDESTALDKIIHCFPYFAVPIAILMLAVYFLNFNDGFGNQSDFGAFGDFFGGILNPILTFLTILLLLRQLRYQRSELHATVKELQNTAQIHKESMRHTQAVDIFEKTNSSFNESLSLFYKSCEIGFVKIPASKDDATSIGGLEVLEDKDITNTNCIISLNTLLIYSPQVYSVLKSDRREKLINRLRFGLERATRHGDQVYILANTYKLLEVNNLLYLEKFERFKDRLIALKEHINSIEQKTAPLQVDDELNNLIDKSVSLIKSAENPQT